MPENQADYLQQTIDSESPVPEIPSEQILSGNSILQNEIQTEVGTVPSNVADADHKNDAAQQTKEEKEVDKPGSNQETNGEWSRNNSNNASYDEKSNDTGSDSTEKSEPEPVIDERELNSQTRVPEKDISGSKHGWPLFAGAAVAACVVIALVIFFIMKFRKNRRKEVSFDRTGSTLSPKMDKQSAVKIIDTAKGAPVRIARIHGVGRRPMQQDSFGLSDVESKETLDKKGIFAIVADGMGGLEDGEKMSQLVVVTMLQGFDESTGGEVPSSLLLRLVDTANNAVNEALGEDRLGQCGSTVVSVIVKDRKLYYLSVGDSHIYVYRNGTITQINKDHNYAAELDEMARNGEISLDEAALDPKRSALTSFIGIGELEMIDHNEKPIALEPGDRVLLMSDGVYGTVYEEGLLEAMKEPLEKACHMVDGMIYEANKANQDNYTCVVLEIRGGNG